MAYRAESGSVRGGATATIAQPGAPVAPAEPGAAASTPASAAISGAAAPESGAAAASSAASSAESAAAQPRLILDPRAKLYLLLLANLLLFFHVDARGEAIMVALFLLPLFAAGRWRAGLRLAVLYAALLGLGLWSDVASLSGSGASGASSGSVGAVLATGGDAAAGAASSAGAASVWIHAAGLLSVGLRMMLPCLITGAYAFTTTSVSEFVTAMRRLRVPEAVVIPCMVVIRFFPTIAHDYRRIREAMALRGIAAGRFALVRHPAQSLEFILVPLLMNATVVSRDLSVAALTKGLGVRGEHTCMTTIRMRWYDWLWMLVCTTLLALSIGGVL
ncbi:energy-coupling factor transporter transmembrane component T [Bifidobacterium jacchi]|uniref:Energy-coupling factor transporter transmembrane protein EcfT n=1 Tax=Bifidobacterium jacchi TaxID=2490545 RepID=A0A5N5RKU3_9BIFI|nr:energy-coupling factor transporter transmembrane component T [Bifidobacterium jacchi]KAB5607908.1 energy-coupling factor transporter transmembrane protein EcfT [Bifidobacterium jacchi]